LNGKMDIRRSGREASYVELAPDATGRVYATRSTTLQRRRFRPMTISICSSNIDLERSSVQEM
jgi:hypothetical protein